MPPSQPLCTTYRRLTYSSESKSNNFLFCEPLRVLATEVLAPTARGVKNYRPNRHMLTTHLPPSTTPRVLMADGTVVCILRPRSLSKSGAVLAVASLIRNVDSGAVDNDASVSE